MDPRDTTTTREDLRRVVRFFEALLREYHPRNFAIRLWDGTTMGPERGLEASFTLRVNHPGAVRRMFLPASELAMGEAYVYDDIDIEGNIAEVFPLADFLSRPRQRSDRLRLAGMLLRLPSDARNRAGRGPAGVRGTKHSIERDRQAVTYHYNVSNDFFALWLDARMVYSCAYFASPDEDLDVAQVRKLDYLCRKLRLKPGERLLDIGCGWGGLVIHAARSYGASVLGITLSQPQADLANRRIREAGLGDLCRVEVRDYRMADEPEGFDKIVSVGMFEHVGLSRLGEYFGRAWRLLKPGGMFLNHGIADTALAVKTAGPTFSERYVFPDGELLPINVTLKVAEERGFEVRDVESLREHYALTLKHWVRRLERSRAQALAATDEPTYRIWRLYMSGSAYRFETGRLNIYQALMVKSGNAPSVLPLTRADLYTA